MKLRLALLLLCNFLIFSCSTKLSVTSDDPAAGKSTPLKYTLSLIAAGDNLFHDSLINSFRMEDGTYDFSSIYDVIKPIVQKADLAFINQETVMAGESFGYSGYPAFNTPQSLAFTHADTGFDIVNIANNHAMDKGASGLISTLDFLSSINEFTVIGARKEGKSARIITKNNITLGLLSYTYGLNGIALPKDNPNLVSIIDKTKMTQEINELRPLCDFLIVSMHWGAEYLLEPDNTQTDLAEFLALQNVDLVIGHHPHVLQKADKLPRADGKEMFLIYSLGNFASHQRERERVIGGMLVVNFEKEDGKLSISDFGMLPVITHYDRSFQNTKIYPLYAYTEELLSEHGLKNISMEFFNNVTKRLNINIITQNPYNLGF
ncbi:MAG: CapA family protein [Treponema sp.]|nr:CapA family protein [Treponema sp.]